jgi:hypothetical protein
MLHRFKLLESGQPFIFIILGRYSTYTRVTLFRMEFLSFNIILAWTTISYNDFESGPGQRAIRLLILLAQD